MQLLLGDGPMNLSAILYLHHQLTSLSFVPRQSPATRFYTSRRIFCLYLFCREIDVLRNNGQQTV